MDIVVAIGEQIRRGDTINLQDSPVTVGPATLAAAVRDPEDDRVRCPNPEPVHRHVGMITADMSLAIAAAIAEAARSTGARAPQAEEIESTRAERANLGSESIDTSDARQALAAATDEVKRLRERVARLGGRVESRREFDADAGPVKSELESAAAELAEAETRRIAAEQRLERLRDQLAVERDRRDRRLELTDRLANLKRTARQDLARDHYDGFRQALGAVPGEATAGDEPGAYCGSPTVAAMAIARMAALQAPIIVATDHLTDAEMALDILDAPVILV